MHKMDTIRVNSRIGLDSNAWLDKRSIESGISKSSLIQFAVEAYIKSETEGTDKKLLNAFKKFEKQLDDIKATLNQ